MIAYLKGTLLSKKPQAIIIEVNGVGYEVLASMNTHFMLANEGEVDALTIQTIVREDSITLYGFKQPIEQKVFLALLKVNGIGPKSALAILSSVTPSMLLTILHQKDMARLVKLPGIGKKTAERLLIELADRLPKLLDSDEARGAIGVLANDVESFAKNDAIEALIALGYKEAIAQKMISEVDDGAKNSDVLIREALKKSVGG